MATSVLGDSSLARRLALIPASLPPMTTSLFIIMMNLAETKELNIQIDIEVEYIIIFRRFLTPSEKIIR
jgi:hypothetical protein